MKVEKTAFYHFIPTFVLIKKSIKPQRTHAVFVDGRNDTITPPIINKPKRIDHQLPHTNNYSYKSALEAENQQQLGNVAEFQAL